MARAALEAVCYQTRDLLEAMRADGADSLETLRGDGGMVANEWMLQMLADILGVAVERPVVAETTALGAACTAGRNRGLSQDPDAIAAQWRRDACSEPQTDASERDGGYAGWREAAVRVRMARRRYRRDAASTSSPTRARH